jgi:deoxyribodipyrimidine photo-lyase
VGDRLFGEKSGNAIGIECFIAAMLAANPLLLETYPHQQFLSQALPAKDERMNLKREFENREELAAYIAAEFADLPGQGFGSFVGGRQAAEQALAEIQPIKYASNRNFLDGKVTKLSMYLRHGILSLAEVRDHAVSLVRDPVQITKFVQELAWRDYYQRVYDSIGEGIWKDRESYKTGFQARDYEAEIPADVPNSQTGLACMDGFVTDLIETGYMHNHARMWFAAYLVHWRRIAWQAGAKFFLTHLLDGDPASNNLSWQWVASTFSHKPYFFNRENLERYTNRKYCADCPARRKCPFDAPYESLSEKLFPRIEAGVID